MAYNNNYGGGGQQQRVDYAKLSLSTNKKPKSPKDRNFGGVLKFADNQPSRWASSWLNGPKENPNSAAAIAHVLDVIAKEGLYLIVNVGDIAPPPQGQGGGGYQQQAPQGGYQQAAPPSQGGGYQQQAPQGGYQPQGGQINPPQQGGFSGGQPQGGSGYGQGGFRS